MIPKRIPSRPAPGPSTRSGGPGEAILKRVPLDGRKIRYGHIFYSQSHCPACTEQRNLTCEMSHTNSLNPDGLTPDDLALKIGAFGSWPRDGSLPHGYFQAGQAEGAAEFYRKRNIVYFDQGDLLGGDLLNGRFTLTNDIYFDRCGTNIHFFGKSFSEWKAAGHDIGSIIADPFFQNADNFDFTLRAESPALKMGFQQIDMNAVGPRVPAGADAW